MFLMHGSCIVSQGMLRSTPAARARGRRGSRPASRTDDAWCAGVAPARADDQRTGPARAAGPGEPQSVWWRPSNHPSRRSPRAGQVIGSEHCAPCWQEIMTGGARVASTVLVLPDQHEFPSLHQAPRRQSVEIRAARQRRAIKFDFVVPWLLELIHQNRNLPPQHVKHDQSYMTDP